MERLVALLENYVEVDEINETSDFKNDLGLASFDTVCLISEIKSAFGKTCEYADFVKFRTVGEFFNNILSD